MVYKLSIFYTYKKLKVYIVLKYYQTKMFNTHPFYNGYYVPYLVKWEKLPYSLRQLKSTEFQKASMRYEEPADVLYLVDSYTKNELREGALRNYIISEKVTGDKRMKKTWAKEFLKTTDWGFNTFAVSVKGDKKHPLRGQVDILLMIQKMI
jgi:hypothetical protein|tara:strand:+ start:829 stop:1281 length:453 start_codon:yes stop_codon:yes gene_type:complete